MKKHLKVTSMLSCTEYRNTLRYWCFTTVSSELMSPQFRKPLIFVYRWWPSVTIVTCRLLFTFLLWLSQITLHFLVVSRIFYRPQTKFVKVLFSTGVCLSTDGGFRSLSRGVSVRETPWTEIPQYGKERAVRILLKCILVKNVYCNEYSPHSQAYMAYIFTPTSPGTLHSQWQSTLKNDFKVKAYLLLFSHVSYVNIIRLDWIDNAIFFCS